MMSHHHSSQALSGQPSLGFRFIPFILDLLHLFNSTVLGQLPSSSSPHCVFHQRRQLFSVGDVNTFYYDRKTQCRLLLSPAVACVY